jgi:hypothetical protein
MSKRMRTEVKHPEIVKMDIDDFEEDIDYVLHSFTERPENLTEFRGALRVAVVADALGENDELTIQYMQLSLQLGVAHFISALELPFDFGVDYLGKKYSYTIKRSTSHVGASAWLKVVYMAIVLRNANTIQIMCSIPTESLREADTKTPESSYRLVDFMKGLFDSDVDIGELLIAAMESLEDIDYMSDIRGPLLSLYRCFLSNDQKEFNQKLDEALTSHKEFWADDLFDVDGWVSMELLAVLSLAKDNKKWSLSAQSDYTPSWLVSGELV